jgi:hypothetical protein
VRSEFFIAGTEPTLGCDQHLGFPSTSFEDTIGMAPMPVDTGRSRPQDSAAVRR